MRSTIALLIFLASCSAEPWPAPGTADRSGSPEQRGLAHAAFQNLLDDGTDEDAIIWYGRRLGYLGRYRDAVRVYSRGLSIHPDSPRLLRHRGHRFISLRRFADAIAALEHAGRLIEGQPDAIEPDGLPNARNQPTSTLHTNVWYHLGLARYCRGEYRQAMACYERCLAAARNPDMEAATRYWMVLTAWRMGDQERAREAVAPVAADWDIIENHAYHRLLLLYAGKLGIEQVAPEDGDAIQQATLGYGLARWFLHQGQAEEGQSRLRALAGRASASFGCIAAEADLRALDRR